VIAAVVLGASGEEARATITMRPEVCGYRYRAEAVQSYKGPSGSIVFFDVNPEDFGGLGREHLLFAYRQDSQQRRESARMYVVLDDVPSLGRERALCRILADELSAGEPRQTLIPFDDDARKSVGEDEWLRVNRLNILESGLIDGEKGVEAREVTVNRGAALRE
jgi:hypothetical protein